MSKIFKTMDGNEAAAYGSYAFTEVAGIYPITPSSPMAEYTDAWSSQGKLNVFGAPVKIIEMQSEAGAAGTVHGSLQAGSLSTTYTASQGLLLMIPNMYKIVGELLPGVFHVSARAIATRSLSIFGDHQDIYACRQTGIPMLCSHSVQEVADLAPVAHLIAIKAGVPMLHFFDGFRTSHEIQKVELQDYEDLAKLLDWDAVKKFREYSLNPHTHSVTRGGAENDDIYFQTREAQNLHFDNVVDVAADYLEKISKLTGREYAPFTYYGAKDATRVIVAMGSVTETIKETIDALVAKGEKVGLVKVHLYRPFSTKYLLKVLPETCEKIAVLDRTKEMGATGEPLYLDVVAALAQAGKAMVVVGGRYGLSSKDTQPNQIKAVFDHLNDKTPRHNFTIGINDDVTHLSLPVDPNFQVAGDYTSCLFYGLGSDGTVGANKNSIKIIGDHTDLYSQAYFAYDSKKAGGATRSNLRFGKTPIRSTYYIENADFISCSLDSYLLKYDMIRNLKKGGTFLLNTTLNAEEIVKHMPNKVKKQLAEKEGKFFIINATAIAKEIGMGRHTNTILQSAFFYLNPSIMDFKDAENYMKQAAQKAYAKKGEEVVKLNWTAIEKGWQNVVEVKVDPEWKNLTVNDVKKSTGDEYFDEYVNAIESLNGNDLPVSEFTKWELLNGTMKNDITYKEKRDIAVEVPEWISENCIQCGKCVFVCPHATIRAFMLDGTEVEAAPEIVKKDLMDAMGGANVKGLKFRIQVSPENCVGCGLCVNECPGKAGQKALKMVDVNTQRDQEEGSDYLFKHVSYKKDLFPSSTVKGVSLLRPYFEVSGSCAGCGEAPYYRLASQLFGKDMLVANATGCSSIYSGSTPATPFATDENNQGPAWANSLFEDNAEFGFGMRISTNYKLATIKLIMERNINDVESELKALCEEYMEKQTDKDAVRALANNLVAAIESSKCEGIKEVLKYKADLIDKSIWIVGGDGWSYDIGFGGVDHVFANNENVNIMILDTEVYSNTGGQASKSSQTGAIAKFAASGKKSAKKDIGAIAMSYKHVYVAQVAMGANPAQVIKAMQEAEAYQGPSVIICYAPCDAHGIKGGLGNHQQHQRDAVEAGYFTLYRYNPTLEKPLTIDSKEPNWDKFHDFLLTENRYNQLLKINPKAEELFEQTKKFAQGRYQTLLDIKANQDK